MHQRPPDCKDGTLERSFYPVNRGSLSLHVAWPLTFMKSHMWLVCHIVGLFIICFWAAIFVPSKGHQHGVSIQSLTVYIIIWVKCFPNISQMKYHTDLILGEAFCIRLLLFAICCAFCIKWFALLLLMA